MLSIAWIEREGVDCFKSGLLSLYHMLLPASVSTSRVSLPHGAKSNVSEQALVLHLAQALFTSQRSNLRAGHVIVRSASFGLLWARGEVVRV